jgi:hypothetical protein
MAAKKARKPCGVCRGKFKKRCLICGWKTKEKIAYRDLSKEEQIKIDGKRNYYSWMHELDSASYRANNCTTEITFAGPLKSKEPVPDLDSKLAEHRKWAYKLYLRIERNGEDVKTVAKELELTVSIVQKIVNLTRVKVLRGDLEFHPRPPTPANPPPPKPKPKLPIPRGPLMYEVEEEDPSNAAGEITFQLPRRQSRL